MNGYNDFDVRQQQYLDQWCDAAGDSFARWAEAQVGRKHSSPLESAKRIASLVLALGFVSAVLGTASKNLS